MFLQFLADPAYGWGELCWDRFGEHPAQVFHEWNTARHSQPAMARSGKRPYTRDELQDLFDCADDRVMRIRAGGSKCWIPAYRMATIMKTAYAWGLRGNEVRSLGPGRPSRGAAVPPVRHSLRPSRQGDARFSPETSQCSDSA
jgi:integrase